FGFWHSVRHKSPLGTALLEALVYRLGSQLVHYESTSGTTLGTPRPLGAGTESDGATGARATGEIGSACGVRIPRTVDAMRSSYAEALCDPPHYLPLARAVEDAGWDGFIVPDSICYPEVSDTKYPYTADGNRDFLEDKPFIEPFSLIPAMGAITSRLRFTTFVVKLPIRQPVLVAKSVASVAVMTQGRFGFGVGLSPWPEDFAVTGTDWKTRGKRMDEMIAIVRGLLRGGYFEFEGTHYRVPRI